MSSLPGADFSSDKSQNFIIRKTLHIIEFFTVYLAFYRATKKLDYSFLLTVTFACIDEIRQTYVLNRTGKIQDVMIDSVGALIGLIVIWKYFQILPSKLRTWLVE